MTEQIKPSETVAKNVGAIMGDLGSRANPNQSDYSKSAAELVAQLVKADKAKKVAFADLDKRESQTIAGYQDMLAKKYITQSEYYSKVRATKAQTYKLKYRLAQQLKQTKEHVVEEMKKVEFYASLSRATADKEAQEKLTEFGIQVNSIDTENAKDIDDLDFEIGFSSLSLSDEELEVFELLRVEIEKEHKRWEEKMKSLETDENDEELDKEQVDSSEKKQEPLQEQTEQDNIQDELDYYEQVESFDRTEDEKSNS